MKKLSQQARKNNVSLNGYSVIVIREASQLDVRIIRLLKDYM